MKIKLLASAQQDLLDGYGFYEQQAKGIGGYHRACLFDMGAIDELQGKTFVKYAGRFVEPLRVLAD